MLAAVSRISPATLREPGERPDTLPDGRRVSSFPVRQRLRATAVHRRLSAKKPAKSAPQTPLGSVPRPCGSANHCRWRLVRPNRAFRREPGRAFVAQSLPPMAAGSRSRQRSTILYWVIRRNQPRKVSVPRSRRKSRDVSGHRHPDFLNNIPGIVHAQTSLSAPEKHEWPVESHQPPPCVWVLVFDSLQ